MVEPPRKKLKESSILDFFGRKSPGVIASQANSALNADTNSGNKRDHSGTFDDDILLPVSKAV